MDFFSWHTASLNVDKSMPVTFCILGHLESNMYMERPGEEKRRGGEEMREDEGRREEIR